MEALLDPGLSVFLGLLLEFGEVELLQPLGDLVPAVSQEGDGGRVKVAFEVFLNGFKAFRQKVI